MLDVVNLRIAPFAKNFIQAVLHEKKQAYHAGLMWRAPWWPAEFHGLFPGAIGDAEGSADATLLGTICAHPMPKDAMEDLVHFIKGVPGIGVAIIGANETVLIRGAWQIDELRQQLAGLLKLLTTDRMKPCIADDMKQYPMKIETLEIGSELPAKVAAFNKKLVEVKGFFQLDPKKFHGDVLKDFKAYSKLAEDGESWLRRIVVDCSSRWLTALETIRNNLKDTYPNDWREFCVG